MSVTVKLNYDQIRDNALQLPSQERIRLVKELEENNEKSVPFIKEDFTLLWERDGYCCYRVNGDPIFTPEEFAEFAENRKKREAEWDNMTPEEIEQQKKQREEAMRRADQALAKIPEESIQESLEIWRAMGLCRRDPSL
ncbi:MAG: hypothetical protein LBQ50_08605 [Planctomycetaceae bacterium]|jgi:hypothetical protein|nr:hypothetical protein [Planctomycetaceae bacterium]